MPRFALGWRDRQDGPLLLLHRDAFKGNLMPTSDPLLARTWNDAHSVKHWFDTQLDEAQQAQLQGKQLLAVVIYATAGPSSQRWNVRVTHRDEEKKRDVRAIEEQVHGAEAGEAEADEASTAVRDGNLFG